MKKTKKKSTIQWIAEFAGTHKSKYVASVITATCGVLCGLVPYVIVAQIIKELVNGNRNWHDYVASFVVLAFLWLLGWYFMEYQPAFLIVQPLLCLEISEK